MLMRVLAALFVCLAVAASAAPAKNAASGQFEILTLSNRADHISGGDALVEVRVPRTVPLHQVMLWLNGLDVTANFRTDSAARTMRGVLTGLEGRRATERGESDGRDPLLLETSLPGVFAAGDVRSGSVKRVASAAGEGAMAVRLVHEHLATAR